MQNVDHTPGPWVVSGDGRYIRAAHGGDYVCDIKLADDDPEVVANAHLIAAAPDLLGALSEIAYWPSVRAALEGSATECRVDAALAKACRISKAPMPAQAIEARSGETVKQGSTRRAKARSGTDAPKTPPESHP